MIEELLYFSYFILLLRMMQTTAPSSFKMILSVLLTFKLVVIGGFLVYFLQKMPSSSTPQACFQESCFTLEVADTPQKRALGLMGREKLPENAGMHFIFEQEGNYSFWMKATQIPLDIFWLDGEGRVLDIQNALPCDEAECSVYTSQYPASQALELLGGSAKKIGIQIGDAFVFKK